MILSALIHYACQGGQPLHGKADIRPQSHVDLARFCGRWYELARFDSLFERGLEEVYADYSLSRNGRLRLINHGTNAKGKERRAHAGACVPCPETPGRLRVSFVPPYRWFYTDYRILFVDSRYQLTLISGADSRYLWLMARSPIVSAQDFFTLLNEAQSRGFRTEGLHITRHRVQPRPE